MIKVCAKAKGCVLAAHCQDRTEVCDIFREGPCRHIKICDLPKTTECSKEGEKICQEAERLKKFSGPCPLMVDFLVSAEVNEADVKACHFPELRIRLPLSAECHKEGKCIILDPRAKNILKLATACQKPSLKEVDETLYGNRGIFKK